MQTSTFFSNSVPLGVLINLNSRKDIIPCSYVVFLESEIGKNAHKARKTNRNVLFTFHQNINYKGARAAIPLAVTLSAHLDH